MDEKDWKRKSDRRKLEKYTEKLFMELNKQEVRIEDFFRSKYFFY